MMSYYNLGLLIFFFLKKKVTFPSVGYWVKAKNFIANITIQEAGN